MTAGDLVRALAEGAPVRTINFHNTPRHRAAEYDRQLAELAERFDSVTEDGLLDYMATGRWPGRPAVIVALYNGYRNNWDVMRPLLERHGLVGWFFVVTGYVDCPAPEQLAYGAAHDLATVAGEYPDGRYALSWDEVRALDRAGHVIASHTRSHARVSDAERLRDEILGSQEDFVRGLGRPVRTLAWLGGAAYREDPVADALLREAGCEVLVSNLRVQRVPRA